MAAEHAPDLAVDFGHLFDGTLGPEKGLVHLIDKVKVQPGTQLVS